ncbi:MAG: HAD-IA family hydrolase [Acidimicrobiia bacterium]
MTATAMFDCFGIIFDLDGVLVDSGSTIEHAWRLLCDEYGLDLDSIGGELHGIRTVDVLAGLLPERVIAKATDRLEELEISLSADAVAVPGAVELIGVLPDNRWAIATSGSLALASARLTAAKVPVPRIMITADDVALGKPHPAPYQAAVSALGAEAREVVVFEDSPAGATSARAAGTMVIGVATTHLLWSFDANAWVQDLRQVKTTGRGPITIEIQ